MYKQVEVIAAAGEALDEPVTVKGGKKKKVPIQNEIDQPVQAPLTLGLEVGRAVVTLDGVELGSVPIVTMEEIAKGNWLNRLLN